MGYKEDFARRVYAAFEEKRAAARKTKDTYGQKELGEEVARILQEPEPRAQPVVSAWMNWEEPSVPLVPVQRAIAQALGVSEDWLVLGKGPMRLDDDAPGDSGNVPVPAPKRPLPTVERGNLDDHGVDVPIQRGKKKTSTRNRPGDRTARAG